MWKEDQVPVGSRNRLFSEIEAQGGRILSGKGSSEVGGGPEVIVQQIWLDWAVSLDMGFAVRTEEPACALP